MVRGITLSILNTLDGSTSEKTLARLPVRIGRNSLNDVCLPLQYVSQFHAVIEIHEDRLLIHDLGSTNGTTIPDMTQQARETHELHVPPNGYFALDECNFEFSIHPFVLRVVPLESEMPSSRHGRSLEEITHIMMPGESASNPEQFASLYQSYRAAFAQLHQAIAVSVERTPTHEREAYLVMLARAYPGLGGEAEFRALSKQAQEHSVGADEGKLARAALAQLRRLAARYLPPHRRLFSAEDVESFVLEVGSTLDVLFRCFLPLRDGHKQFETQMRLERGSRSWPGPQGLSVETATNVAELAYVLLDWSREDQAQAAAEGIFADIMIHQVALLNGVMEGVKTLLAELSPQAIEALAERKQRGALGIGPFRYRQLWDAYSERHKDLAEEERFAFELIFGPRFAAAYKRFHNAASLPTGGPTVGSIPPPKPTPSKE